MKRLLAALALLTACSQAPSDPLSATAARLDEIRSGVIDLRVGADAGDGKITTALHVTGPFQLAQRAGGLPIMRLTVERAPGIKGAVTITSDGSQAFIEMRDGAYTLPTESLTGESEEQGRTLRIDRWIEDPTVVDGGLVDGVATDRIEAKVDLVDLLNDFTSVASSLGAQATTLRDQAAQQVRNAVRSATATIWTGRKDRLLRRLIVDARLEAAGARELKKALGALGSARLRLELTLRQPNEPVNVQAPASPRPLSELRPNS